jgi:hypothetical protein
MSENGKLPASELAPIAQGQLATAAAAAWNAMNIEARRRGIELLPTGSMSSYRTLEQQQYLYNQYQTGRGSLAAIPGTSNHGWGLAVDVATQQMRTMIDQIGAPYGWSKKTSDAPSEWWHLKYLAGIYHGPDPGPYGTTPEPAPALPEGTETVAVHVNENGHTEIIVQLETGEIRNLYKGADGRWKHWETLGNPGR